MKFLKNLFLFPFKLIYELIELGWLVVWDLIAFGLSILLWILNFIVWAAFFFDFIVENLLRIIGNIKTFLKYAKWYYNFSVKFFKKNANNYEQKRELLENRAPYLTSYQNDKQLGIRAYDESMHFFLQPHILPYEPSLPYSSLDPFFSGETHIANQIANTKRILAATAVPHPDFNKALSAKWNSTDFREQWKLYIKDYLGIVIPEEHLQTLYDLNYLEKSLNKPNLQIRLQLKRLMASYNRKLADIKYQILFNYLRKKSMLTLLDYYIREEPRPIFEMNLLRFYVAPIHHTIVRKSVSRALAIKEKQYRYFESSSKEEKEILHRSREDLSFQYSPTYTHLIGRSRSGTADTHTTIIKMLYMGAIENRPSHWYDYLYNLTFLKRFRNFYLIVDFVESLRYDFIVLVDLSYKKLKNIIRLLFYTIVGIFGLIVQINIDIIVKLLLIFRIPNLRYFSLFNLLAVAQKAGRKIKDYYLLRWYLIVRYKIETFILNLIKVFYNIGVFIVYLNYSVVFILWVFTLIFKTIRKKILKKDE